MSVIQHRRSFLAALSAATTASLLGGLASSAQEGPPEITTIRLAKIPGVCIAPQFVAEDLLKSEGFTDVQYVESGPTSIRPSPPTKSISAWLSWDHSSFRSTLTCRS